MTVGTPIFDLSIFCMFPYNGRHSYLERCIRPFFVLSDQDLPFPLDYPNLYSVLRLEPLLLLCETAPFIYPS
jgi:hypothetical protein